MERKSLTKSLHTVTAVTRVAKYLRAMHPATLAIPNAVSRALVILGQEGPWEKDDPTVLACIAAFKKGSK